MGCTLLSSLGTCLCSHHNFHSICQFFIGLTSSHRSLNRWLYSTLAFNTEQLTANVATKNKLCQEERSKRVNHKAEVSNINSRISSKKGGRVWPFGRDCLFLRAGPKPGGVSKPALSAWRVDSGNEEAYGRRSTGLQEAHICCSDSILQVLKFYITESTKILTFLHFKKHQSLQIKGIAWLACSAQITASSLSIYPTAKAGWPLSWLQPSLTLQMLLRREKGVGSFSNTVPRASPIPFHPVPSHPITRTVSFASPHCSGTFFCALGMSLLGSVFATKTCHKLWPRFVLQELYLSSEHTVPTPAGIWWIAWIPRRYHYTNSK